MIELRLKTKRKDSWMEKMGGKFVTPDMLSLSLTGLEPVRILKPDGKPLCVYLPRAALKVTDETFPEFSRIRGMTTNRGYASGTERITLPGAARGRTQGIASSILGSFDPAGPQQYCRLTAFTAREVERWDSLLPYFQRIAELLEEYVPERYANQLREARNTRPDWIIKDTPFTTITVNNTYPTACHTDKGDLDAGFSTLGTMRRGNYIGGHLAFPQFGCSVDMKHGDVLLMDAHEWHGNTPMCCADCEEPLKKYDHICEEGEERAAHEGVEYVSPERVSVVSYFRTKMTACGTLQEENSKRLEVRERLTKQRIGLGAIDEEDDDG